MRESVVDDKILDYLTEDIKKSYEENKQPPCELASKMKVLRIIENYVKGPFSSQLTKMGLKVNAVLPFGSTTTNLGTPGGDLDIVISTTKIKGRKKSPNAILGPLYYNLKRNALQAPFKKMEHISSAKNFHGMPRSFFSTDEEFPTQLQNFEGRTTSELQELKDRVAKLEKLVDGLQSNMLKNWNMTESGTRYKLFEERKNWEDAEKYCQTFGGHLAVIDNDAKNNYTKELLLESQTADFAWIGMKTKTTNQSTTFTNFASDSPIDGCAVLDKQGVWSIRSCIQLRPFICQIIKSNVDV